MTLHKDLSAKAGITAPPTTWDELIADAQKLKAAGIAPISLGGKDRWPDAFYWDYLAVRSTPAQQGATSSADLLANGKAAMELQGHWNPSVMTSLTPPGKGLGDKLGWFPFPEVSGGAGTAGSVLGGGDGFSCSRNAPPECVDFLKYIVSPEIQKRWAGLNIGPPVAKGAEAGVTDPNLRIVIDARGKAPDQVVSAIATAAKNR